MSKAYLEPDEVERLERAADYLRDRLLIRLLFHLGCRVSEALGIRESDIDFRQSLVNPAPQAADPVLVPGVRRQAGKGKQVLSGLRAESREGGYR